ncbi:MAG: hypothetical protein ACE5I1_33215 [bacterium]
MPILTEETMPSREKMEEIARKAQAHYNKFRKKLEKEHWGEFVVIHPDNGDFAIADEHWEAVDEMQAKYPDVLFFTIRIGYRAFAHFGGRGALDGKKP